MTAAKNAVFIGLQLENCCLVWGIDFWWLGGGEREGVGMSKFSANGGDLH